MHIGSKWRNGKRYASGNQKTKVVILISDKIDFTPKTVTRDNEGYYIMIKGSTDKENTITVHIYAPNIAPKYIKQRLTDPKEEIDNYTRGLQFPIFHNG